MADEKPLHVVELRAENVKRLHAITIRPDGSTVLIGGRNAQGKSSTLDAIEMALGGGKSIPLEPVRHGARKARIVLDLGDIVVERTFSAKGSALEVRGKDGIPKASPQKLLDSLCSKVAFDPLEFARTEPKKQDETLKRVLGLDFSDIEAARAKLYEQRATANREVKRLEALLESTPEHRDAPVEAVDVAEVAAMLKAAGDRNATRAKAATAIEGQRATLRAADREIEDLETRLASKRTLREALAGDILAAERDLPPEESVAEFEETIRTAEQKNAKVRANAERKKTEAELKKQEAAAEGFTETIESLDDEKAARLAAAKFPIEGLGFDEAGPTLNGVPLAQASQAEALRLSVAIGAALNPRVKVMLIREGSRLDDDGLALLAKLADETGSQLWIERVGTKDAGAIVIEDGEVVGATGEAAAE